MIISDNDKLDAAKKAIADADLILVGIGSELSAPRCDDDEIRSFLGQLKAVIGDKKAYIITLNTDGIVRECGLNDEYIVEPCGTIKKLQCEDNCSDDIYMASDYTDSEKICPKCGRKLIPNTVDTEHYAEAGYLDDWKKYTTWISATLNRKLCVLEFGVKMEYPNIIRWPFEKIVSLNNKATFIRINNSLPQLSENVGDKGISIKGDPCRIVGELAT